METANDKLRAAFQHYRRSFSATTMYGDSDEEFKRRLKRTPPDALTPDELSSVLWNYCRQPRDLKYYLPRLLELASQRTAGAPALDDIQLRMQQLDYDHWPIEERNAVDQYLASLK